MTEREKMIAVIKQAFEEEGRMLKEQAKRVFSGEIKKASQGLPPLDEFIADALIAAGIGDVTEWKERAEKAEKEREEYRKSTRIALKGIEILKRNIIGYFVTEFPSILQQAELEIEEEK